MRIAGFSAVKRSYDYGADSRLCVGRPGPGSEVDIYGPHAAKAQVSGLCKLLRNALRK